MVNLTYHLTSLYQMMTQVYQLHLFFVADETFILSDYVQRSFEWRNVTIDKIIFNYQFTIARRMAEGTFGIINNKGGILAIIQACYIIFFILFVKESWSNLNIHYINAPWQKLILQMYVVIILKQRQEIISYNISIHLGDQFLDRINRFEQFKF